MNNTITIHPNDQTQLLSLEKELEKAENLVKQSSLTVEEKWLVRKYAFRQDWDIVKSVYEKNPYQQRVILGLFYKWQEYFWLSEEFEKKYNCLVYVHNNQVVAKPFPSTGIIELIVFLIVFITLLGMVFFY